MLKKTITYTDFNGTERTEDFFFNLTEAELVEMEYSDRRGFEEMVKEIINAKDNATIIKLTKQIVLDAYGQKSEDGRRFIKNDTIREEFSQTNAYSKLFMELASDDEAAAKFMEGIVPKNANVS